MIVRDLIEHIEHCIEMAKQDSQSPLFPEYPDDEQMNREFILNCEKDIEALNKMPMSYRLDEDELDKLGC